MLCTKPFVTGTAAFPCGQCMPCRIRRRRLWVSRLLLEASQHSASSVVTLTYSEERLPVLGNAGATLVPKDAQDWLKRLRARIAPMRLRFYLVGEYGDESWRPHYHAVLFGVGSCLRGRTEQRRSYCCEPCELVRSSWGHGRIESRGLDHGGAQYVCGYVTKKMTRFDDARLEGRHPEFARMSLRPGLGADALWDIADQLMKFNLEERMADVPSGMRTMGKERALGRYLRRKLRTMVGKNEQIPQSVFDEIQAQLRPVYEASIANKVSFAQQVVAENEGRRASLIARSKIYQGGKVL